MKLKRNIFTFVLITCSVAATYFVTASTAQQGVVKGTADTEYQSGATLFMQKAAEYRALAYQAYNLARWQLDADFDKKNVKKLPKAERKKPRALMIDIDETVLDNSPNQAFQIKNRIAFNNTDWLAWVEMRKAKAVPGAVDFVNYADSKGVKVFFVSNRNEVERLATIENLKRVGITNVRDENVLLRTTESSKETRREVILRKHRIVFFVGDNLDDHSMIFERKSIADRFAEVDKAQALFGTKYIVLPNAMYGTWESAIYEYGRLNDAEKAEKRAAALELP
ncbi:MAG: 5'-nucleotidase, lipoprotein e(P4) family [Pyrinomonadaceae bacterium]